MKNILTSLVSLLLCVSIGAQPGSLDPAFGNGGRVTTDLSSTFDNAFDMVVQPDGKIILAGTAFSSFAMVRYNVDGTLDPSFDLDGVVITGFGVYVQARGIALQNDGKIVLTGGTLNTGSDDIVLARYHPDGSLDNTFDSDGKIQTSIGYLHDYGQSIAIQNDGKIVVAGTSSGDGISGQGVVVARYNTNGSPDVSFDHDGIAFTTRSLSSDGVRSIALQRDGKILVAGNSVLIRYNTDGSVDDSFNGDGLVASFGISYIYAIAVQNDGKILIGGVNYKPVGQEGALLRINSNGSPDLNFGNYGLVNTRFRSAYEEIQAITVQNDGKILVAGQSLQNNDFAVSDFVVARYNGNGGLDETFGIGGRVFTGFTRSRNIAHGITLSGNRIYVGGGTSDSNSDFAVAAYRNNDVASPCAVDNAAPLLVSKNISVSLDASGLATIQPADVIQSLSDNCTQGNAIRVAVSPNTFSCLNIGSDRGYGVQHQAYISAASTGNQDFYGELGLPFNVNIPGGIVINQLGAFDHQGNGINGTQSGGSIRVAIFNALTKTIVPGLDVLISGTADSYVQHYRFKNITPVTLAPGEYVLVAKGYNLYELNGNALTNGSPYPAGNDANGAITFLNRGYYGSNVPSGFSYPVYSTNSGSAVFLAGSFNYTFPLTGNGRQAYISNTTTGNQDFYGELGMEFRVNAPGSIVITQLGVFDHQSNGIRGTQQGGSIRVAIFNKATQTIVPGLNAYISGPGDGLLFNYRVKNIPPVILPSGEYVLVAKGFNINELNGNSGYNNFQYPLGDNAGGAITFLNTVYYGSNQATGFSFPRHSANMATPNMFLAGTFNYQPTALSGATVMITATDAQGNSSTSPATVFVQDNAGYCKALISQSSSVNQEALQPQNAVRSQKLTAFPNPSNGKFSLQLPQLAAPKAVVEILDANGNRIEQRALNLSAKPTTSTHHFDLTNQPSGMYLFKVITAAGVQTTKLIIQH